MFFLWLVAFAAGFGGLCFGYEIGVIGQVLPMRDFGIRFGYKDPVTGVTYDTQDSANLQAWITTSFTIGCFFGALFSSRAADLLSRRWSIFIGGVVFVAGAVLQAVTVNLAMLIIGRAVSGISIGFCSMSVPLYISEAAPTKVRGALITVYQLMITIGILIATAVNAGIVAALKDTESEWRIALGVQAIPGGVLGLLMLIVPYSPRWLMFKGRDTEALNVLAKLQSAEVHSESVQFEYNHIKESIELEKSIGQATWAEVFGKGVRNRVFIGFFLQFFQQWTGINVILYYGPTIFEGVGFSADQTQIALPLANAAVNVVGTLPGMYLIDRIGRKKLLVYGGLVQAVAHYLVCLFFGLSQQNPALGWGAIISVYIFILGFSSTWGPVVWVYQSEIFPLRVRARGTGICTMSNWGWNAVVGNTAPRMFNSVLGFYTYIVYGTACVIMVLFTWFFVPETMNKSLEDMDEIFGAPEKKADTAAPQVVETKA